MNALLNIPLSPMRFKRCGECGCAEGRGALNSGHSTACSKYNHSEQVKKADSNHVNEVVKKHVKKAINGFRKAGTTAVGFGTLRSKVANSLPLHDPQIRGIDLTQEITAVLDSNKQLIGFIL